MARWYLDIFEPENFYLEIQEHHGIFDDGQPSPQGQLNQLLYQMHKEMQLPMVATNDLHYVDANDAGSHDVLLCVQTGKQLDSPKRMKFDSHVFSGSPKSFSSESTPQRVLLSVRFLGMVICTHVRWNIDAFLLSGYTFNCNVTLHCSH